MGRTPSILAMAAAILLAAAPDSEAQSVLTQHVREAVLSGEAPIVAQIARGTIVKLDLVLSLRDAEGLDSLLAEIYDPASPSYRQFLTVAEFTAKFAPSQEDY